MWGASVSVDAGLLAIPGPGASRGEAKRYVKSILFLKKLLGEKWVSIYISGSAAEMLVKDDAYPLMKDLQRLEAQARSTEFNAKTIAALIPGFLKNRPSWEERFRVRFVLVEDCSTTPDVLRSCAGPHLREGLQTLLVVIASLRSHSGVAVQNHAVVMPHCQERSVRIRALVHGVEPQPASAGLEHPLPSPPEYFEGDVEACEDFGGFLACVDAGAVLSSAEDDVGIELAIRIALHKSRSNEGKKPKWDDAPLVGIGSQFRKDVQRCTKDADSDFPDRLLRSIVDAIERRNPDKVHKWRTSPGGGSPKLKRADDGARAQRRDIDQEYHLHYWEEPGGRIYLAAAGVHNDSAFPEW